MCDMLDNGVRKKGNIIIFRKSMSNSIVVCGVAVFK